MVKEVDPASDCSAGFLHHLLVGTFILFKVMSQKTSYSFPVVNLSKFHWAVYKCVPTPTQYLSCVHYAV